jgi:RNA polymerase nonessential primary-like sigma factor
MDLSKYYAEIMKEPLLSKDEEVKLFKKYKSDKTPLAEKQKIKERVIKANLRFCFRQAKKYSKNDPDLFVELISAANEGLLVGFDKFNPGHKTRFLSYVGWWVKQRILKEMSRMRIVSLPIYKQQLSTRIFKLKENNENITLDEVIKAIPDASPKDIKELFYTRYLTYYIDDMQDDNVEFTHNTNIEEALYNKHIYNAVMALSSPYKEILSLTYGFEDGKELTVAQIAKKLMLTKDQFKELKKEAHEMMKVKLKPQLPPWPAETTFVPITETYEQPHQVIVTRSKKQSTDD